MSQTTHIQLCTRISCKYKSVYMRAIADCVNDNGHLLFTVTSVLLGHFAASQPHYEARVEISLCHVYIVYTISLCLKLYIVETQKKFKFQGLSFLRTHWIEVLQSSGIQFDGYTTLGTCAQRIDVRDSIRCKHFHLTNW